MHTTQVNISVTETGLLLQEFTQGELVPHEWVSLEWEQQSEVIMDRQFLIIFSHRSTIRRDKQRSIEDIQVRKDC